MINNLADDHMIQGHQRLWIHDEVQWLVNRELKIVWGIDDSRLQGKLQ